MIDNRRLRVSLLVSMGIISASIGAASVALACNEHASKPREISPTQTSVSDNVHRPAWSREMLNAHNHWRRQTGVSDLTWSDDLAKYAQSWANHLAQDNFKLYHRPNNPYGENLTWAAHQQLTPTQVVNMWGDEVQHYHYETNHCSSVCGHYTQLVWQNTTQVGCARVSAQHQEVWVCNYNPPGNYRGQKPYQALLNAAPLTYAAQVQPAQFSQ